MAKRRKHTPEFKLETVELVRNSGCSINQIGKDLGLNPNMISR